MPDTEVESAAGADSEVVAESGGVTAGTASTAATAAAAAEADNNKTTSPGTILER
jgi:hypothetical protein